MGFCPTPACPTLCCCLSQQRAGSSSPGPSPGPGPMATGSPCLLVAPWGSWPAFGRVVWELAGRFSLCRRTDGRTEGPLITRCRLNHGQKKGAFVLLSAPPHYLYVLVLCLIGLHDFFALDAKMDGSFQ